MTHIMLDLETFGTAPGSVLRSIGAVEFDLDGSFGAEFYRNIDKQSCIDAGLKIDPDTAAWWEQQGQEAQAVLLVDPLPLAIVVREFHDWFLGRGVFVWSHGANFDEPLWCAAARAVNQRVPWKYWNVRCTRTLYHVMGFDPRSLMRAGTHHNALDDAKHQAHCVQAAFRKKKTEIAA